MRKKENIKRPEKDIAIARAQFCWETEAFSGRVLHYYGGPDGILKCYPSPQEVAEYRNLTTKS